MLESNSGHGVWICAGLCGRLSKGNTDGEFLNKSTTRTNDEQGAWWQVDLGSQKKISQIIIYNQDKPLGRAGEIE
jgi:hypothetical protein